MENKGYISKNILKGINKVFREALTCETEEELARTCLAVAEELTDSKFGFIGEVNEAGRYDCIALSDRGWSACRMGAPLKQAGRTFGMVALANKEGGYDSTDKVLVEDHGGTIEVESEGGGEAPSG